MDIAVKLTLVHCHFPSWMQGFSISYCCLPCAVQQTAFLFAAQVFLHTFHSFAAMFIPSSSLLRSVIAHVPTFVRSFAFPEQWRARVANGILVVENTSFVTRISDDILDDTNECRRKCRNKCFLVSRASCVPAANANCMLFLVIRGVFCFGLHRSFIRYYYWIKLFLQHTLCSAWRMHLSTSNA